MFVCVTNPIKADDEVGTRVAHTVKTSGDEPPSVYCGDCVYRDNPQLLEVIAEGKAATKALTEEEVYLKNLTAVFGGTR